MRVTTATPMIPQKAPRLDTEKSALASFLGYAFSNNVGAVAAGIPLRARFYSAWGVTPAQIVGIIAFLSLSFWVGFCICRRSVFIAGRNSNAQGHPSASDVPRPWLYLAVDRGNLRSRGNDLGTLGREPAGGPCDRLGQV